MKLKAGTFGPSANDQITQSIVSPKLLMSTHLFIHLHLSLDSIAIYLLVFYFKHIFGSH